MRCCRRQTIRQCICWSAAVVTAVLALHAFLLMTSRDSGVGHRAVLFVPPESQLAVLPGLSKFEAGKANYPHLPSQFSTNKTVKYETHRKSAVITNLSLTVAEDRIPLILHQTWISDRIPATYVPFAKSWTHHKPPLAYYYWTDDSSLRFVAKHYPELLATFRGYKAHLSRADAIRYMLLHHYGGIYADMDMMRLKDLTPLLNSSSELCYLSQERYEITRLYWGLDSTVMNAIMLSAPRHKFMEFVVKALPRYAHHTPNVMESTGPFFLQNVYNEYQKSPPCNLSSPLCRCAVADPYLFMPQVDPIRIPLFRSKCYDTNKLKPNQIEACEMLEKIGWRNDLLSIGGRSFTHHGFLHYGFENQRLKFDSIADISSVRPEKEVFERDFL